MHGKEYMAPCTGLQRMPGASLKTCSVTLALAASSANTACLSYGPKARQAGPGRATPSPTPRPLTAPAAPPHSLLVTAWNCAKEGSEGSGGLTAT